MRGLLRFGLATGALIFATGCNGFPDSLPLAEAENKPEKYPTYAMSPAINYFMTPGQRWMPVVGAHVATQAFLLTPLSEGVSRLSWDQAPYDMLFGGQGNQLVYAEVW